MKKLFPAIFIGMQIFFVILLIYKQSRKIEFSYSIQRYEKERYKLLLQKEDLMQHLYSLKSHSSIKKFAQKHHMKKLRLSQIKTVTLI